MTTERTGQSFSREASAPSPRLRPPDPPLADDEILLRPLTQRDAGAMLGLTRDEDVLAFTRVPSDADETFVTGWIERYEQGWQDGSCAAFSIRERAGDRFLGFAAVVELHLDARECELGYMVASDARGRGVGRRSLALLTRWCFDQLELERLELRIDVANRPSERLAERCGYRFEGVLRNLHVKEDVRADLGVWSLLRREAAAGRGDS